MVVMRKRREGGKRAIAGAVNEALASAGVIILITSAGGAFGYVLRQTGIADADQGHRSPPASSRCSRSRSS